MGILSSLITGIIQVLPSDFLQNARIPAVKKRIKHSLSAFVVIVY